MGVNKSHYKITLGQHYSNAAFGSIYNWFAFDFVLTLKISKSYFDYELTLTYSPLRILFLPTETLLLNPEILLLTITL